MKTSACEFLAEATADDRALLYRSRWSKQDARRVVPQLAAALSDANPAIVQEALRSLFIIGNPAAPAAPDVARLVETEDLMTRRLAVLALGQIAHKDPNRCLGPVTAALKHRECRHDALRILAFLGRDARRSLSAVISCYASQDAHTRRLAVKAALAIDKQASATRLLVLKAARDRSASVRAVLAKAAKTPQPARGRQRRPRAAVGHRLGSPRRA
jgi:HEAT repeat protein